MHQMKHVNIKKYKQCYVVKGSKECKRYHRLIYDEPKTGTSEKKA